MYWKEILDIYERMGVENIIPIAHTRIKPNIKVLLDESGNFVGATLNEQDRFTIPCTIESESRTSGCAPHPIHDNMQYLCNEYNDPKCKEKNESYMKQLGEYIEEVDDELAKSVFHTTNLSESNTKPERLSKIVRRRSAPKAKRKIKLNAGDQSGICDHTENHSHTTVHELRRSTMGISSGPGKQRNNKRSHKQN